MYVVGFSKFDEVSLELGTRPAENLGNGTNSPNRTVSACGDIDQSTGNLDPGIYIVPSVSEDGSGGSDSPHVLSRPQQ